MLDFKILRFRQLLYTTNIAPKLMQSLNWHFPECFYDLLLVHRQVLKARKFEIKECNVKVIQYQNLLIKYFPVLSKYYLVQSDAPGWVRCFLTFLPCLQIVTSSPLLALRSDYKGWVFLYEEYHIISRLFLFNIVMK